MVAAAWGGSGIILHGNVSVPLGYPRGQWQFVQTVVPNYWRYDKFPRAPVDTFKGIKNGMTCGDSYPIRGPWPTGAGEHGMLDAPHIVLGRTMWRVESKGTTFKTYIMFKPTGDDSCWVPLMQTMWGWKGLAENPDTPANQSWRKVSGDKEAQEPADTSIHPTWTTDTTGGWQYVEEE